MSSRRRSCEVLGGPGSPRNQSFSNALQKISAMNAFAKSNGMAVGGARSNAMLHSGDSPSSNVLDDSDRSGRGGGASGYASDSDSGASAGYGPTYVDGPAYVHRPSLSPYYGMYRRYEEVMELLRAGIIADGGARRMLSGVTRAQVVHVAHLGLGACATVDLVAVHLAGGERVVAAAKSCYLPASDPRLKASLKEVEVLNKCADCPFIMQLLLVLHDPPGEEEALVIPASPTQSPVLSAITSLDAAGAALAAGLAPISISDGSFTGPSPRSPPRLAASPSVSRPTSTYGGPIGQQPGALPAQHTSLVPPHATHEGLAAQLESLIAQHAALTASLAASGHHPQAYPGSPTSAGFQQWSQWRGGGTPEQLQRMMSQQQLLASPTFREPSFTGSPHGPALSHRISIDMGDSSMLSTLGYGTTGMYGTGGFGACGAYGGAGTGVGRGRRTSQEILGMYGECCTPVSGTALEGGGGGGAGGEPASMCTLLIGWARCGDLRRLVQLLLGRSPAHQPGKGGGGAPPVAAMPLLMSEDAARYYAGCLLLALEHLHVRLRTVHRDLKLANLLLLDSGVAIVGDLGTAVDLGGVAGGRLTSRVGSPGHMAPEVQHRDPAGYDCKADIWSMGACLHCLVTGQLPAGVAGPQVRTWTPAVSKHWSPELQALMGRLLAWSPAQRPDVQAVMRDPWYRGFNWRALREQRMLPPADVPWPELLWWPKERG